MLQDNYSHDLSYSNLSEHHKTLILLDKLEKKIKRYEEKQHEQIAIVSMALRLPGGIHTPEAYWQAIKDSKSVISEVPQSRWSLTDLYHEDINEPGKLYMRHGAFLQDREQFDAKLFGISPAEARSIDPQHRLLLEVAWEAMENAGLPPKTSQARPFGVFIGIGQNDYSLLQASQNQRDHISAHTCTGNGFCFASGRLAYLLNFNGPNMSIDTACSSSLVAIHQACQAIKNGECNIALAGGVQIMASPETSISLSKAGVLSRSGKCSVFDDNADGFVRGEGCGVLVLMKLSEAMENNHEVLGIIRGSAVNHNGKSSGLTVPNGDSQRLVMQQALKQANMKAHQIDFVEAHGTGTRLGDPIELEAIQQVYAKQRNNPLYIGSTKSITGHAEAAAGVIGLIKTVLALKNKTIPPHQLVSQPNQFFNWEQSGIKLSDSPLQWELPDDENSNVEKINDKVQSITRAAGVSSFGLSGTNAHLIVQEHTSGNEKQTLSDQAAPPAGILCLSSNNNEGLDLQVNAYHEYLQRHQGSSINNITYSANTCRSHLKVRKAFVAADASQLAELLQAYKSAPAPEAKMKDRKGSGIAFLFTGQGSQYLNMGRELFEFNPVFRDMIVRCDKIIQKEAGFSLITYLYPDSREETVFNDTFYIQPCLFSIEYALFCVWRSWGIHPDLVIGHSLGEYVAACVAGVFSLEDGLKLVCERARLAASLPVKGKMVAVAEDVKRLQPLLEKVGKSLCVSVINDEKSIVVSGSEEDTALLCKTLAAEGIAHKPLAISAPFHSSLMNPVLDKFRSILNSMDLAKPQIKLITNVEGRLNTEEFGKPQYWCRHLTETVQFHQSMKQLSQQDIGLFLEVGPSPILTSLAQKQVKKEAIWLSSICPGVSNHISMYESLARFYELGIDIDWPTVYREQALKTVRLPNYVFQSKPYWVSDQPQNRKGKTMNTNHRVDTSMTSNSSMPAMRSLDEVVALFKRQNDIIQSILSGSIDTETFSASSVTSTSYGQTEVVKAVAEQAKTPDHNKKQVTKPNKEVPVLDGKQAASAVLEAVSNISQIPVEEIGLQDSLVENLGFDSISLARLVSELGTTVKGVTVDQPLSYLKNNPTIEDLINLFDATGLADDRAPTLHFDDIDDILGDHRKRFFGEGYKKIHHHVNWMKIDRENARLSANASINYVQDWSSKAGQKELKPHLSVLDALLLAFQVNEYFVISKEGLYNGQCDDIWVSAIHMKAGVLPELNLDSIPIESRILETVHDEAGETVMNKLTTRVGPIQIDLTIHSPLGLHDEWTEHYKDRFTTTFKESFYGGGYRHIKQKIKDIGIDTDANTLVAKVGRIEQKQLAFHGHGASYYPFLSWVDVMMTVGQLVQALVYKMDGLSRDDTNNMWMREFKVEYKNPITNDVDAKVEIAKSDIVTMNDERWRYADLTGNIGSINGFVSVTHKLREDV